MADVAQRVDVVLEDGSRELVEVRLWAAAREAAGADRLQVPAADATSCAHLVATLSAGNDRLRRVLAASSLLVAGQRRSAESTAPLPLGSEVEVLPPFAGG